MERNLRKTRVGIVTSDKMDKTVVVTIKNRVRHPLYNKIVNDTVKYKAHDENNECGIGDKVLIMECRPYSRIRDGVWLKSLRKLNNRCDLQLF
jgi:small subunit ribosomal protein S17